MLLFKEALEERRLIPVRGHMADPLSLVALGAAVGGAAGKFVEKAWDSGEKWVTTYFKDHQPAAQQKAIENSGHFLADLSKRLEALEKSGAATKDKIASAQEQPDFSVLLQRALISSAQTSNSDKHELLSRLVAERVKSDAESVVSLASKMACDAIAYASPSHLKILGLAAVLVGIQPSRKLKNDEFVSWLQRQVSPFAGVRATHLDFIHMESLSCLVFESFITRDLQQVLVSKGVEGFDYGQFAASAMGKSLVEVWETDKLKCIRLTSVGQLIGILVSDQLSSSNTDLSKWA